MIELPKPDGENDRFFDPGAFVYTKESVLAIQKQAYEDGLRDAAPRRTTKRPGTLEISMEYHLPEKILAATHMLSSEQLSHAISPHLIVGDDAMRMYMEIASMLTASQKEAQ